jgi:hypothetical protein
MGEGGTHNGVREKLSRKYLQLLDKIEGLNYPCPHLFYRDLGRFVQADEVFLFVENRNRWEMVCRVREHGRDKTVDSFEGAILDRLEEILGKITWLPLSTRWVKCELGKRDVAWVVPDWVEVRRGFVRCLSVLVSPRVIDLEGQTETAVRLDSIKAASTCLRCWFRADLYKQAVLWETEKRIAKAAYGVEGANRDIKALLEYKTEWPRDVHVIRNVLRACWGTYLRVRRTREKEGTESEQIGEGFWEVRGNEGRGDNKGRIENGKEDRSLWENYLERQMNQRLCEPKGLCGEAQQICPKEEVEQREFVVGMGRFVKWPVLFADGRYDYFKSPEKDKEKEREWLAGKFDEMASFTKSSGFMGKECIGDGNAGQRPFVLFC